MSRIPFLRILAVALLSRLVCGFDFVVSPPTQCGQTRFTWIGGQPPFRALIIPPGGSTRNISIPGSAFNGDSGDFSTPLNLPERQNVVFSMGDATGATAGGLTDIMAVGPPASGQTCNTTDPGTDFVFSLDGTLAQCKPYPFTLFSGAVQPITILVSVPHGESFFLHPPTGDSFNWQANLTAGTAVFFSMTDSLNRIGGTSPLTVVGPSDDASCVRPLPPSSAPTRLPTPTSSPSSNPGSGNNNNGGGASNNGSQSNMGLIIGASVGGAVVLIIIIILVLFLSRKKKSGRKVVDLTYDPGVYAAPYSFPAAQQQSRPNPYPPYSDAIPPAGPGLPPAGTMMYNNVPMTGMGAAGYNSAAGFNGAAGVAGTPYQRPTGTAKHQQLMESQEPLLAAGASDTRNSTAYYPSTSSRYSMSDSQTQFGMGSGSNASMSGPSTSSSAQSKRPPGAAPRFIVHTDIEDTIQQQEEAIELPPQYDDTRAPLPGMSFSDAPAPPKGRRE